MRRDYGDGAEPVRDSWAMVSIIHRRGGLGTGDRADHGMENAADNSCHGMKGEVGALRHIALTTTTVLSLVVSCLDIIMKCS